jgi:hypothetical protein
VQILIKFSPLSQSRGKSLGGKLCRVQPFVLERGRIHTMVEDNLEPVKDAKVFPNGRRLVVTGATCFKPVIKHHMILR